MKPISTYITLFSILCGILLAAPVSHAYLGACTEFPPIEDVPAGYVWRANCSYACESNADCKEDFESDSGYVYKPSSYWCHGFTEGSEIKPKCMQLLYTQEDVVEEDKLAIQKLLETLLPSDLSNPDVLLAKLQEIAARLNGETTGTPADPPIPGSGTSADGTFEGDVDVSFNFADYGLPSTPNPEAVQTNLNKLKAEPLNTWAKRCLYYEKYLKTKNVDVKPYLTCGWAWFEGALDPNTINCKDNPNATLRQNTGEVCRNAKDRPGDKNSLLQVGGYQAFDRATDFQTFYQTCVLDRGDNLTNALQQVFNDSNKSANANFSYVKQRNYKLVQQFGGQLSSAGVGDIARNKAELSTNDRKQFFTLLLGKHSCIQVGMNSRAVNNSFIGQLRNANDSKKLYGYIGNAQKQRLTDMLQAMVVFDKQNNTAPPSGGTNPLPTSAPNTGASGLLQTLQRVVDQVKATCNATGVQGSVAGSNASCLNTLASIGIGSNAIATMQQNASNYVYLQCMGFVQAMWAHFNGNVPFGSNPFRGHIWPTNIISNPINNIQNVFDSMDFNTCKTRAQPNQPVVWIWGQIGVYPGNQHIAWGSFKSASKDMIDIYEANADWKGKVQTRTMSTSGSRSPSYCLIPK